MYKKQISKIISATERYVVAENAIRGMSINNGIKSVHLINLLSLAVILHPLTKVNRPTIFMTNSMAPKRDNVIGWIVNKLNTMF